MTEQPHPISALCVFCGSSPGIDPVYADAARAMGTAIAERGIRLVYGGGHVGLMGVVADAALRAGGQVVGIIPEALQRLELAHLALSELHVVRTMHERKALMNELSDGFIAMPGGFGTLEEFCEVLTWAQLGIHRKPCGLLNTNGFYTPLLTFFDQLVTHGFLHPDYRTLVLQHHEPHALLDTLMEHVPLKTIKWVERDEI
jgi:uncharacterized protein (TIGR00730 family)